MLLDGWLGALNTVDDVVLCVCVVLKCQYRIYRSFLYGVYVFIYIWSICCINRACGVMSVCRSVLVIDLDALDMEGYRCGYISYVYIYICMVCVCVCAFI